MMAPAPIENELVLVGGGHAHALALRMLVMKTAPVNTRITLVSPASHTPYSGMLPGMVAGHYRFEETHIDLARLCQWAGVRFITDTVIGFDPVHKNVHFANRPVLPYDVLSLDIGSQPDLDSVPGAREYAIPVKPVSQLWERWQQFATQQDHHAQTVAVVGAGAGGVEMTLAMAQRLRRTSTRIVLVAGSADILPGYHQSTRAAARKALEKYQVQVLTGRRVTQVQEHQLCFEEGAPLKAESIFWCTAATPAAWVANCGLKTDERGFLLVNDRLQSVDNPWVFAAGDIATQAHHPRPKAGVYAVRQAPVLAHNLRALLSHPNSSSGLKEHHPQERFLSLLSLGERFATGERGPFHATGAWVWRWKDHIDRKFMRLFSELSDRNMTPTAPTQNGQAPCGGCGAKIGSDPLRAALASLNESYPQHALPDNAATEDVARIPGPGPFVQSIDSLRGLVADPFTMGTIAAQHALSDLYAAAAQPISALAHVVLPYAKPSLQQADLEQLLAGALAVFADANCPLLGGHSMQGPELQIGFLVNGQFAHSTSRQKNGAEPGDHLVLTKPIGIGALFAAHMQLKADGRHIAEATELMCQSNAEASRLASQAGVVAATDVTGFGLLGHLAEMLPANRSAQISVSSIPLVNGALAAARQQIKSTLWPPNYAATSSVLQCPDDVRAMAEFDLLFDPQTSGGLLLSVPASQSSSLLHELAACGHRAAVFGHVFDSPHSQICVER